MSELHHLLVEIGTEELPPKALRRLAEAFGQGLCERLTAAGFNHGEHTVYATPRRLAVVIDEVPDTQPDREHERRGPALSTAFDADGNPTKAALGFAGSVGVAVDELERLETEDGGWLVLRSTQVGESTVSVVPSLVEEALGQLPIPKRMRWSDLDIEFVRPVRWVALVYGEQAIEAQLLGVTSGRRTYGHRFHHPGALPIEQASGYAMTLYGNGHVVADFEARQETIREQVEEAAAALGGHAEIDAALLEENTALVEWPAAIAGSFDTRFLELPDAVLAATMKGHQRYFPVADEQGALMAHFIAVCNIESHNPDAVRTGNERVIRPRLDDAAFFFEADMQTPLADRQAGLKDVVFQDKLGSMHDKAERVSRLTGHVAIALGESRDGVKVARRAGTLCKCDLRTQMVGEFPDLQGLIGREYALRGNEPEAVANALAEAYLPRFAGDGVPRTATGQALAIADKLDTLVGIFGVGETPTGDKDPYALRRAALGVLRIMIEGELPLDLRKLLHDAVENYKDGFDAEAVTEQVYAFMMDRLRAYFVDQGVPAEVFIAVQARQPTRPHDFARRVRAVDAFRKLPEAASLCAANKRIQNILKQAKGEVPAQADDALFTEDAEWNLAAMLVGLGPRVREMLKSGDYEGALTSLAGLRDNVDTFFDSVKVMHDDPKVRDNRLALLTSISSLFLETADISRLQPEE